MWRKISAFSRGRVPWTRRSILLALFFTPAILPSSSYLWVVTLLNHLKKGQSIIRWGILECDMDDFFVKLITVSFHILFAFEEVNVIIHFSCRISKWTASISSCHSRESTRRSSKWFSTVPIESSSVGFNSEKMALFNNSPKFLIRKQPFHWRRIY